MNSGARAAAAPDPAGDATLYAEDLPGGTLFPFGSYAVTPEEVVSFAAAWDPLPMHLDVEAARRGPFGELVASGVHTFAIFQRLQVEALLVRTAVIAGRGMRHMRLPAPTRAGAVLTGSSEVLERQLRPHRVDAVVVLRGTLVDQEGSPVFEMVGDLLVSMRPHHAP